MKVLKRNYLLALGIPTIFIPGLILAAILGWDWQNDLGKIREVGQFKESKIIFPDKGVVSEVYDGDTFLLQSGQTIRLLGINAPDRGETGYENSWEYLRKIIDQKEIRLEYDKYQDDKYGRTLAYVFQTCTIEIGCEGGQRMVNWVLVKEGLAKTVFYKDRGKLKYQDQLQAVE